MKTIGIAAVTAEGAATCYKSIVSIAGKSLGANKHPEVILDSPSFDSILTAQNRGDWHEVAKILTKSINKLATAGAEMAIIPANSVHFAFDEIKAESNIPVLNIVELAVDEAKALGYHRVGVLGVGLTMEGRLYEQPLARRKIASIPLSDEEQATVNSIIYNELVQGKINRSSVDQIVKVCVALKSRGCDALILACTELPMALNSNNSPLPFIDTTALLAEKAVRLSLV